MPSTRRPFTPAPPPSPFEDSVPVSAVYSVSLAFSIAQLNSPVDMNCVLISTLAYHTDACETMEVAVAGSERVSHLLYPLFF